MNTIEGKEAAAPTSGPAGRHGRPLPASCRPGDRASLTTVVEGSCAGSGRGLRHRAGETTPREPSAPWPIHLGRTTLRRRWRCTGWGETGPGVVTRKHALRRLHSNPHPFLRGEGLRKQGEGYMLLTNRVV